MTQDDQTARDGVAPDPHAVPRAVTVRIGVAAAALLALLGLGVLLAFTELGSSLDPEVLAGQMRGLGEWGYAAVSVSTTARTALVPSSTVSLSGLSPNDRALSVVPLS